MKSSLLAFALLWSTTLSFAQFRPNRNGNANNQTVQFYSRSNYKGDVIRQGIGTYRTIDWTINSIQVPQGYVVEAFSQPNFRGESVKLMGNVAQSGNQIRSLRISRDYTNDRPDYDNGGRPGRPGRPDNSRRPGSNDRNGAVVLYMDDNYRGGSATLNVGRHRSSALGQLNRQASSIQIPEGYSIQVFENDSFSGPSYTLTSSSDRLRNIGWNDRISSIIISRTRY
ncbi:hypothetical protein [Siphonobacter sp. SORGH_AS_1065]|uniref:hypothetical protein n=1 Tax=Siphonobacter sp. SORGH_AS_1065 TaxID=3041795 RepID=UPI002780EB1A|nr:hypothetical protein [Siphonobacter sp. SORGH_AS_1065]MDQ1088886.1 hypothetical protein [Siphonobacter sp. SORGH_AS_1065]